MKADVLELFRLGNKLTVENGYPSYIDLVLAVKELDRARLLHLLNDFFWTATSAGPKNLS